MLNWSSASSTLVYLQTITSTTRHVYGFCELSLPHYKKNVILAWQYAFFKKKSFLRYDFNSCLY